MSGVRRGVRVAAATFAAMEGVSYATHRWVMHGPGMRWHASHHAPSSGRFERNDLYPLAFSAVGTTAFGLAHRYPRLRALWPVAAGITAYGAAYLVVHELYIHRRARLHARLPSHRYVEHLRRAHRDHHVDGGEPFGMLLPLGRRRHEAVASGSTAVDPLLDRRSSTDASRARL